MREADHSLPAGWPVLLNRAERSGRFNPVRRIDDRDEHQAAPGRRCLLDRDAEGVGRGGRSQGRVSGAGFLEPPVTHEERAVGERCRQVEIVEHRDHGETTSRAKPSEERHERHATQAGAIHDPEPHMFVWCRFEFDRFPDERVVSAKPVVAR